jgi:hypothetical protein
VRQWIAEDTALRNRAAVLEGKIFNHKFNSPNWAYIDPTKDANGDATQLEKGLISPRRWANGRGYDIDELNDEIVADNASRIRKALAEAKAIEDEFPGAGVTWREILDPTNEAAPQLPAAPPATQAEEPDEDDADESDDPEQDDQGADDDSDT